MNTVVAGLLLTVVAADPSIAVEASFQFSIISSNAAPSCLPADHPFRHAKNLSFVEKILPEDNVLYASGVAKCGAVARKLHPHNPSGRDCSIWPGDREQCLYEYVFQNPDQTKIRCTFVSMLTRPGMGFSGCEFTSLHAAFY